MIHSAGVMLANSLDQRNRNTRLPSKTSDYQGVSVKCDLLKTR